MSRDTLADRGKGLEDAFFANQDAILRRRLADLDTETSKTSALSEASGIKDLAVLDHLVSLGLSATTLAAISLVPLVAVAWADGQVDAEERKLLLAGAAKAGLEPGHPGHAMLDSWLKTKPQPALLTAWDAYMKALPAEARATLKPELLAKARAVAEASGGFLRIGTISGAEQTVLDELADTLDA